MTETKYIDISKQMNLDYQKYSEKHQSTFSLKRTENLASSELEKRFGFIEDLHGSANYQTNRSYPDDAVVLSKPNRQDDALLEASQVQEREDIVRVAANLTEATPFIEVSDYIVSQIGDYQIWKDKDEIAVIDTQSNKLIVYGELERDFFAKLIPQNSIQTDNSHGLLAKVSKFNPNLDIKYEQNNAREAAAFILPLDPSVRIAKIEERRNLGAIVLESEAADKIKDIFASANNYFQKASKKLNSTFEKHIVENVIEIEKKSKLIASKLLAKNLAVKSIEKFVKAYEKTGESKYQAGEYSFTKDKNFLKIHDKNNKLILNADWPPDNAPARNSISLKSHTAEVSEIIKALKAVKDGKNRFIGSKKLDEDYKSQVFGIISKLNKYENGSYKLNNSNIKFSKNNNKVILSDNSGNKLIETFETRGAKADISATQIKQVVKEVDNDLLEERQDTIVAESAKVVNEYLKLNDELKIDKKDFLVSFDPKQKVIKYTDKQNSEENFEAVKVGTQWQRSKGQISQEKFEYFQDVGRQIARHQNARQSNQQTMAPARRF